MDLETGAVVAVEPNAEAREVVADKGYHSNETVLELKALGLRSYLSETDRGRRNWKGNNKKYQAPVYANRRRIRGTAGATVTAAAERVGGATVRASVRDRGGCVGSSSGGTPTCASDC